MGEVIGIVLALLGAIAAYFGGRTVLANQRSNGREEARREQAIAAQQKIDELAAQDLEADARAEMKHNDIIAKYEAGLPKAGETLERILAETKRRGDVLGKATPKK